MTKQNVGSIIEQTYVLILSIRCLYFAFSAMARSKKFPQKIESRAMENNVRSSEQLFQTHSQAEAKRAKVAPKSINSAQKPDTLTGLHVRKRIKASFAADSITGFNVRQHMKAGVEVLGQGVKAIFGAVDIQMERENGRLRIDFIEKERKPVELLPLLESLKDIPPLTAVLGWSGDDQPVLLDLQSDSAAHALIVGNKASGKTTLLRALALSLAICNKESRLQMIFLTPPKQKPETSFQPFTQLPHLLTPISADPHIILETLDFLVEEIQHRLRENVSTPAITVFADNLPQLMALDPTGVNQTLTYLVRRGAKCGVHLVMATDDITHPHLTDLLDADVPARLVGQVNSAEEAELGTDAIDSYAEHLKGKGDFLAAVGDLIIRFQAADILDKDLNFCVDHIQRRRPPSLLAQELYQQAQQIQLPESYQEASWYAPSQQKVEVPAEETPQDEVKSARVTPRIPLTSAVPTPPSIITSVPTAPSLPTSTPDPNVAESQIIAKPTESAVPKQNIPQETNRSAPEPVQPKATRSAPETPAKPLGSETAKPIDTAKQENKTASSSSQMKHMASIFASLYPHSSTPAADLGRSEKPSKVDQHFRSAKRPPPPPASKTLAEKPAAYQPSRPRKKPTPPPVKKSDPKPLPEANFFEEEPQPQYPVEAARPVITDKPPQFHFTQEATEQVPNHWHGEEEATSPLMPKTVITDNSSPYQFVPEMPETADHDWPLTEEQPHTPMPPQEDSSPFFSKLEAGDIAKFNQPPPPPPITEPEPAAEDPWLSGLLDIHDEAEKTIKPTLPAKPRPLRSTPPPTRPTPAPNSNPRDLIRVVKKLGRSKPVPKPSSQTSADANPDGQIVDPQSFIESQALPDQDDLDVQAPLSSVADIPELKNALDEQPTEPKKESEPPRTVQKPRRVQQLQRRPKSPSKGE